MSIVFKTNKSALNTTSGAIQVKNGDNLQTKEVTFNEEGEFTVKADNGYYGLSEVDITIDVPSDVHNQNVTIGPETTQQVVTPEEGYTGFGQVTVEAVTSAIDANIQAGNIKKDVTILGVTGNFDPTPNLSNLNITPSINAQEYNPAISGVDGYSLVRVNAVTASIDSNIQAENILAGVTILGVEGSDEGYQVGYDAGVTDGEATGYQSGYDAGYADGEASCPAPALGSLSVTPSTSAQSFDPTDEGYEGFDSVSVSAVTAAIDNNITAGNIKNGVSILGVTGNVVEANFEPDKEFYGDVTGIYTVTPQSGHNGFEEVQVTVESNPIGSFWNPFEVSDNTTMGDVYNKLEEGGYFDGMYVLFGMGVDSGSIDSETGYYIAEDGNGNSFAIEPFFDNPDYDPELSPEDQPDVPALIFPENFDLSGLNIQVEADFENVTITENEPEDPNLVPTYTTEIALCALSGINWNSDMES